MTAPDAKAPNKNAVVARIAWLALILATLYVCYFSHLGAIGLVGPDEPRYAWIARDMAETGDWVTPRLYGRPWFEKPPLYYWGAAMCFKLFGVSEVAARLPSALSALLATLAVGWLAWRVYGAATARWLLLFLPTSVAMIGFSHAAATDMPFSAMLTIAMVCVAVVLDLPADESWAPGGQHPAALPNENGVAPRWPALILFGFFMGLAVLAKGPAGVILCGGVVFFWVLGTKRWRDALRLLHPAAIAAFCATALPWYILCGRRNPDFFRIFIIEHNVKRYLTPEFRHLQPFWFYIPVLLISIFPWVGMAISAVDYAIRRRLGMQLDSLTIYVFSWAWFPVIFFSVSKSKLPGYILPAIPAFVLLTALALANSLRAEKAPVPAGLAVIRVTPALAIAVVGATGFFQPWGRTAEFRWYGLQCLLLSSIATVAAVALRTRKRQGAAIVTGSAAWVCLLLLTTSGPLPWSDPWFSARPMASEVLRDPEMAAEVRTLGLQRSWQFGLDFYLQRELQEWDSSAPAGYVLASASGMQELNRHRIPFQVLDQRSFKATLIRVGNLQADRDRRQKAELPAPRPKETSGLVADTAGGQAQ